ncbi:MAG: DUF1214 domain-containing protein [Myxococcota bacterium]
MTIETDSRAALHELIALLQEIDQRWSSEEWNLATEADIVGSHRALMHILEASLVGFFEQDAAHPDLRRITTLSRKLTGDNPDAIYFDAPVSAEHSYVIHGETKGASYFSVAVEEGTAEGKMASRTAGTINDSDLDIDSNGNFTLYLGGEPRERNWMALTPESSRLTTRHYFEQKDPAQLDPALEPYMRIECLNGGGAPPPPDDARVAAGIRRVANVVRSRTLEMPPLANSEPPAFVSLMPNEFPAPVRPGDYGFAAYDAHYSLAPFYFEEGQALVIKGRWPTCRFANVCLWNRFQQTFDYQNRQISLNRAQTVLEDDGSFRLVLSHEDPGVPNWIDTEGNLFGIVFWRFFMVDGDVETPEAEVVELSALRG